MQERLQRAIDEILGPLLEADGGGVEFLAIETPSGSPARVHLRLTGKAAFSVGGRYIRTLVIEPLLRKVCEDPQLEIVIDDAVSRPNSRELEVGEVVQQIRKQEAEEAKKRSEPPSDPASGETEIDGGAPASEESDAGEDVERAASDGAE